MGQSINRTSNNLDYFLDNIRTTGELIIDIKEIKELNGDVNPLISNLKRNSSKTIKALHDMYFYYSNRYNLKKTPSSKIDFDFLVVSRFIKRDWKKFIKDYILSEIKNGSSLQELKNEIVLSILEYEKKTKLNFTWDLYNDIRMRLFKYIFPFYDNTDTINEISYYNIQDDIKWVNELLMEDLSKPKEKLSKYRKIQIKKSVPLKAFINDLFDSLGKNATKDDKQSISNLVKATCGYNNEDVDLSIVNNLDFLKEKKISEIVEFFKIFFYAQQNNIIISKYQKDIILPLSYIIATFSQFKFNSIKRGLEGVTKQEITNRFINVKSLEIVEYINK